MSTDKDEATRPDDEPVAWLVEGWHDGKLIAHIVHLKLDEANDSASVFATHYSTVRKLQLYTATPAERIAARIDMVLHCPKCGMQHLDRPEPAVEHDHGAVEFAAWNNPPHRSHLCHFCGHIWRPANVPTNGVAAVKTAGKADSPVASPINRIAALEAALAERDRVIEAAREALRNARASLHGHGYNAGVIAVVDAALRKIEE